MKQQIVPAPEWITVTLKVTRVLEALAVPYFIGGSGASIIYGVVRATMDADLVASLRLDQVQQFTDALQAEFYVDPESIRQAIATGRSFNIIHQETMFKVDIFLPKGRTFDQSQFARRIEKIVARDPEAKAWFASAEDTVLAKLEWFRTGNQVSERQWRDVLGVLKIATGTLDIEYMRQTAPLLAVEHLLERALEEAAK